LREEIAVAVAVAVNDHVNIQNVRTIQT